MTMFQWAIFLGLIVLGTGLGLVALVFATGDHAIRRGRRHHDHLIPATPRRAHG